jgi:hypothetical protein
MPIPSSSTIKRRPINIEKNAMKLLTFFYTLLNKKEKTELKKEIKDIGKKTIGEIVGYMNDLIGKQRGGAASIIGASSNSIIKFVLLLVCLLYINMRVEASIKSPMIFEKLDLIHKKKDKNSLSLDHSQVWKDTMSVIGTSTDVKHIYREMEETLIKEKWTGLQAIYPGEATIFEPYYNLYKADGCMISDSAIANVPYTTELLPENVIPKVYKQLIVLKDAGVLSNDDYEKLGQIATSYILGLPPNKLNGKMVCDMHQHTMILLMSQQVSTRLEKETQAQLESKPTFTEPESKAEVNGMFKQIIDYFKGSKFIIVLLGFFGLCYLFLNMKRGKSKTVKDKNNKNNKNVIVESNFVNGIEMLKKAYQSSSDENEIVNKPIQAIQTPIQAPIQAHIIDDITGPTARALGLPIEFRNTSNNNNNRSRSRSKNRLNPTNTANKV